MASYKPYIKKSNDGAVDELPLDATTLGGIGANGFAKASHTHDDRYYTESEIDAKLESIETTPGPQGPQGNGIAQITNSSKIALWDTVQSWVGLKGDNWIGITNFNGKAGDTILLPISVTDRGNQIGYMRCEVISYNQSTSTLTTNNLDFMYGPQGPKGDTGPQGPKGDPAEPVNLGYYDTITENSDGTYTITRQTGFRNISIDLIKNGAYRTTQGAHGEYGADTGVHNLPIAAGSKNFINNLLPVRDAGEIYSGSIGISISENGMCWVNLGDNYTTTEQYREYFAKNNIYVQYKLATATTEKVEKNYLAQYNQRFILEHNKSEAEKSANVFNKDLSTLIYGTGYEVPTTVNDWVKVYQVPVKGNTVYSSNKEMTVYASSDGVTYTGIGAGVTTFTTSSNTKYLCFCIYVGTNNATISSSIQTFSDLMLNEGHIALPYQPYSGKPVHKKEFEDFKNSMKFIPYISVVETTSSEDISENGTYFVIPTDPASASLKLQVKAGPRGTLQTAYFSGGIISVFSFYDSKLQTCGVQITYGAGSDIGSTQLADTYNPVGSSSGIISRITGKCKIYKL